MKASVTTTYDLDLETVIRVLAEFCGTSAENAKLEFQYRYVAGPDPRDPGERVPKGVKLVVREQR